MGPVLLVVALAGAGALAVLAPDFVRGAPGVVFVPALLALLYATFAGGLRVGLWSAALFAGGSLLVFSLLRGDYPGFTRDNWIRLSLLWGLGFAATALVGTLETRIHEGHARAIVREREQARELHARNHELSAANRALADFSHVATHDLKEPVRALTALLEAFEEDERERVSPEGRERLRQIRAANERLSQLVKSLLEYARATRIETSDQRPLSVGETLAENACAARFSSLAAEREARIVAPPVDAPRVMATPAALSLILGNLVANAIRHNSKPSPLVHVRVVEAPSPSFADVIVEDDGAGFSPDARRRFEEALEGREEAVSTSSSGFGLLIVARAAEKLGGRVELGRSPLGGAAVRVRLPMQVAVASSATASRP